MAKECCTRRSFIFRDEIEGELLYESDDLSWIERSELGITVKIRISKNQNWKVTADQLHCEVRELSRWLLHQWSRGKIEDLDQLPTIEYDPYEVENRDETLGTSTDPYLYTYLHDDGHWVIYEGTDDYLFVLDLPRQTDVNVPRYGKVEDFDHFLLDKVDYIYSFLTIWYDRVNGYPEDDDDYAKDETQD